jgi:type II secretory pathway pseudopilin PulG
LIEIMAVVGILGIVLAMGAPPFFRMLQKEGMRKAVDGVVDVCSNARALAILRGTPTEVIFHPLERQCQVGTDGSSAPTQTPAGENVAPEKPPPQPATGLSAQLPANIDIEMLDINFLEYNESDMARVRFFPNGTSDEMTLILHSMKNDERRKISLEGTTGLAMVGDVR